MKISFVPRLAALALPLPAAVAVSPALAASGEVALSSPGKLADQRPERAAISLLQVTLDVTSQCAIVFPGNDQPDAMVRIDCSRSVPWLANLLPSPDSSDLRFEAVPFSPEHATGTGRIPIPGDESRRVRLGLDF